MGAPFEAALRKRVGARWGISLGLLAALLGHLWFWYLPRERGASAPGLEAQELLFASSSELAIWLPFPHQNLGQLEARVGDVAALLLSEMGTSGESAVQLPSFGPFRVPPAFELAVAFGRGDRQPRAVVHTYPLIAWTTRAAGRLAGNPWLGGGEVTDRSGGTMPIVWRGNIWRVGTTAEPSAAGGLSTSAISEPLLLGLVRLGSAIGRVPAGLYRIVRGDSGLEARLGRIRPGEAARLTGAPDPPIGWVAERRGEGGLSAIMIWEESSPISPLPTCAVLTRGRAEPFRLPGRDLLRLAGRQPARGRAAGFEIEALSEEGVQRATSFARELAEISAAHRAASLLGDMDPRALGRVARKVGLELGSSPIAALLGFDPGRWARWLAPWESCGRSSVEVWNGRQSARWWVCEADPAAPSIR